MPSQNGKKAVPRFTSFKTRPEERPTNRENPSTSNTKPPASHRSPTQRHKTEPAKFDGPSAKHAPRVAPQSTSHGDAHRIADQQYRIDLRGDADNLRYGSLHKYSIPYYRRWGHGSVMGTPRWMKIDQALEGQNFIELRSKLQGQRKNGLWTNRPSLNSRRELMIEPSPLQAPDTAVEIDFIPIISTSGDAVNTDVAEEDLEQQSSLDNNQKRLGFRSTPTQTAGSVLPQDTNMPPSKPEQPEELAPLDQLSKHIATLDREIKEQPTNGRLWIELVNAHRAKSDVAADIHHLTRASDESSPSAEARLSILRDALKAVKDVQAREELLIVYMAEAAMAWESDRLIAKWQELIIKNQRMPRLALKHIGFLQTNFSAFRFNDIKDATASALAATSSGQSALPDKYEKQFEILCQLLNYVTSCARDAGYSELANAIWQANLEFNLHQNQLLDHAALADSALADDIMAAFESFWDSEDPRIGEASERLASSTPVVNHLPLTIGNWSDQERAASKLHFSAKSTDEEDESDPYRVVLASDVVPFLVSAKTAVDKHLIINSFLAFCQLPPYIGDGQYERYYRDSNHQSDYSPDGSLFSASAIDTKFGNFACFYQMDDTTLFADPSTWFCPFSNAESKWPGGNWHRSALVDIAEHSTGNDDFVEYCLGLELHEDPIGVRKTAKRLLKSYANSVRLYNAFAWIEIRLGRMEAAESVLRTVLDANQNHDDVALLWRTWIWSLMEKHKYDQATSKLLTLVNGDHEIASTEGFSTTKVLKASKTLQHNIDQLVSIGSYNHAIIHMELRILLEYLSTTESFKVVMTLFSSLDSAFNSTKRSSRWRELLHQFRARLIYVHHQRSGDFAAVKVREIFRESIAAFPDNTIFPTMLEIIEPWTGANDRIHKIMMDLRGSPSNISSSASPAQVSLHIQILTIQHEFKHFQNGRSNIHAVRHAFEQAITSPAGIHSPVLWKGYVLFEADRKDLPKAKNVFYRAIRACPWVKDIYMLAFGVLAEVMNLEELRALYELMEDKELRIRVPLNDVLEK